MKHIASRRLGLGGLVLAAAAIGCSSNSSGPETATICGEGTAADAGVCFSVTLGFDAAAACGAGTVLSGGACVPAPDATVACGPGTVESSSGQCLPATQDASVSSCGAGTMNVGGVCVPVPGEAGTACGPGTHSCGSTCYADDDATHCGIACTVCSGTTPICVSGACHCTGSSCSNGGVDGGSDAQADAPFTTDAPIDPADGGPVLHITSSAELGVAAQEGALADFDGDGRLDLAFAGEDTSAVNGVVIALGDGKGNFVYETTVTGVGSPTGMDVGDFNDDHKQDLVVTTSTAAYVALGKGDGTFQAAVTLSGPPASGGALVRQADFDQDGWPDLAIGNNAGLYILMNDKTGHFPTANLISMTHAPDNRFAVGDINGDTLPDIGFGNNNLYLALSSGDAGTGDAGAFGIVEVPSAVARYVAFGSLNGSGPPDIVTTDTGNTPIYVAVQRANGTLIPQVSYETSNQSRVTPLIGDFDNAGNLDVFVGIPNGSSSTAEFWHGNGDGTLAPPIEYPLPNAPLFLLMGDVTNDGKLDVVSVGSGAGIIATTLVQ
jgi:hypothetical protein